MTSDSFAARLLIWNRSISATERGREEARIQQSATVRLFGRFDLRFEEDGLARVDSARAHSLLGYLLLHNESPQARQQVAFMLWPDSSESQARTNLRHLLHTIRRGMPQLDHFLEVTTQTLWWRPDSGYWLDVTAFEKALGRADGRTIAPEEALAGLREAIDMYRGDLLDGCEDEWVTEDRERLRERYMGGLGDLMDLLARRGDYAEAIRFGRELLRCDPLHEYTYRSLMRMHHAAGDPAGAVRVYHECASVLQRELGVDPSPATVDAYARLARWEEASVQPEVGHPKAAMLVGRDTEWQRLTELWMEAERGRHRLALVTGEPGIGKSRLVEELAAWCSHRGAVVAQARSYATEGELGYGVVISWLRSGDLVGRLRSVTPSDATELSRLMPELRDGADPPEVGATEESEARRLLFDALARVLTAPGRPTLLVADDAQWCDAQSLQLIHYLLRAESDGEFLVVVTARREEIGEDHPLESVIGSLHMSDRSAEIALGRLTRPSSEQLAVNLAGKELGAADLDALYSETEGNPLFIVETIRAGWGAAQQDDSGLPPKLRAIISARIRRLSRAARDLLEVAAAVGREFNSEVLARAAAFDDITFVRAVDELWRHGLVREHGTGDYDFGHGKIRDVTYAAMPPATRSRNHILIAQALIASHEEDLDGVSGEVARHLDRGGKPDEAASWYQRAAVQAQRLRANQEAIRLLERARELVAGLPKGVVRLKRELEIVSMLAIPLAVEEGFASARLDEVQGRAVALAASISVDPDPPLLRSLAMSNLCRDDFDGARRVAARLHRIAEAGDDDVLLIESDYLSGIAAFWNADFETARRFFERVVDRFDARLRAEHLTRFGHDPQVVCLSRLANTLLFLGQPEEALDTRDRAVALATEVAHAFSRGVAYVFAAALSVDLGQTAGYRGYVDGLLADFEGRSWHRITGSAFQGYAEVLDGLSTEGIERIRSAIADAETTPQSPGQHALLMRLLVAGYAAAGDPSGGLRAVDEALDLPGSRVWESDNRRLRAEFLAALGADPTNVELEFELAAAVARRQGATGMERRVSSSRARVLEGC